MEKNSKLLNWMPHWDDTDEVDGFQQELLRDELKQFIDHPIDNPVFVPEIPFRIVGEIYNDDRFDDGDGIMTSFVKEIRRVATDDTTPNFDVITRNSTYRIRLCDSYSWM